MLDIPVFWVGPLGRLMPMPVPAPGVTGSPNLQAARNSTLNARNVFDVQGYRREWVFTEAWLTREDYQMLEAMYLGLIKPPMRLIDPRFKNRIRANVSVARRSSLWWGGANTWHLPTNSGSLTDVSNGDYPGVSYISDGDEREVEWTPDTYINWNCNAGSKRLYPNGALKANTDPYKSRVDPILPGESLTYSFYVKNTGTTFGFGIGLMHSDGTNDDFGYQTFNHATWTRVDLTWDYSDDPDVVGLYPYFISNGAGVLSVGPAQLEVGTEPTAWEPGYGAPEVMVTLLDGTSPRFDFTTASMTITEL